MRQFSNLVCRETANSRNSQLETDLAAAKRQGRAEKESASSMLPPDYAVMQRELERLRCRTRELESRLTDE